MRWPWTPACKRVTITSSRKLSISSLPLELDTRSGQLGQRVLLCLAHRLGGGHLSRGDVLNSDVDLLVDLRVDVNRPVFHVALRTQRNRVEIDLDDIVPVDGELALEFRAVDQRPARDRAVAALGDHPLDHRL